MNKIIGIPHIILSIKDLKVSKPFYTSLFVECLGGKVKKEEKDWLYFGLNEDDFSIGISEVNEEFKEDVFNRYRIGLHHFALEVSSKAVVDTIYEKARELGAKILDVPQFYPHYHSFYYAVYFEDPDGMKMEFVAFTE